MPSPLECAIEIVAALDRMRTAEKEAIEASDALGEVEEWPGRFFNGTHGMYRCLRAELEGTSGSEYDLERIYADAVEFRELMEIATLEDGLLVTAD